MDINEFWTATKAAIVERMSAVSPSLVVTKIALQSSTITKPFHQSASFRLSSCGSRDIYYLFRHHKTPSHLSLYSGREPGQDHAWHQSSCQPMTHAFPCSSSYPPLGRCRNVLRRIQCRSLVWVCSLVVARLVSIVLDWIAHASRLPECFTSSRFSYDGGVTRGSASESIPTIMVGARDNYIDAETN